MFPIKIDLLLKALSNLGVASGDNILLHTSFKSLFKGSDENYYDNILPENYAVLFLKELKNYIGNGCILIPTEFAGNYNLESLSGKIYDPLNEPSNRGFLTEIALKNYL